jgi:hypothetical protein
MHPHLGEHCLAMQRKSIKVNLIDGSYLPTPIKVSRPLKLATKSLCARFLQILNTENLDVAWLKEVVAEFVFQDSTWPHGCVVVATTEDGRVIETAVRMGKKARVFRAGT